MELLPELWCRTVSKTLFKKLLLEGKIIKSKRKYKTGYPSEPYLDLYEFVESENEE